MQRYNPSEIEPGWQKVWADERRYQASDGGDREKFYISPMFPYPSAAGMHSGHAMEHSVVDAIARFQRAHGRNVMNPMGWDAFGLPAENYAIKTGMAPAKVTKDNIANFTHQLKRLGASIDWSREINTSDPDYYRWTQWVFTKFFERGLAYQKDSLQWWCPIDQTVLANEQVINGKCWRHDGPDDPLAEKKNIRQWFFKITDYADALLEEIPALDWPEKIKTAQTNWIGKSQGAEIEFLVAEHDETLTVFTTRPDTIFGATFMVIAPEHSLVEALTTDETHENVDAYVKTALKKSEIERQSEGKEKTGVFTGSYAINPATGEKIPIWIADYVLGGYGTGAIMAVPAHDERDYEFAEKYKLPVVQVVAEHHISGDHFEPELDAETIDRNVADAVICDGEGNYLLQTSTEGGVTDTHFVGGGIEQEDSSTEDGLRREVAEETGYTDIVSVRKIFPIISGIAYRPDKGVNHRYRGAAYEVMLGSKTQIRSEVDEGKHTIEWITKDQVAKKLTWQTHLKVWLAYLDQKTAVYANEGVLVNSGAFDGMPTSEAREEVVAWLEEQGTGKMMTTYKMRDWLISRQRYWGAPIPIIHCEKDGAVAVPEDQLPVVLPEVEDYAPKGDGKSVLARVDDWVNTTCPECGGPAKRETDTMDGYACSSWYLLRYTDPKNDQQAWSQEKADYWTPVDYYVGGDHAVAHLLYVRFWNHVFYDMGLVPSKEPVKKLVYHGLIQAEDGRKMSKSLGNVIDPLDIIDQGYGADALRTFLLFVGPIEEDSAWSTNGLAGVYRFLTRVWTLTQEYLAADTVADTQQDDAVRRLQHKTTKKVTEDLHRLSFNTAIAAMMEATNELYKLKADGFSDKPWRDVLETMTQLLAPFAPHLSAELWQQLGHEESLDTAPWPSWDEALTTSETATIVVQVNGKVRAKLEL
ncbi:TPA: leucine--tRNA ligase, partial [Candidatus Saccharibacteria bacterium]|nr:leucine--tRNA ligase [Candidatus Saccharibacteria bacterium]